jgi:hypothetical protein
MAAKLPTQIFSLRFIDTSGFAARAAVSVSWERAGQTALSVSSTDADQSAPPVVEDTRLLR